MSKNKITDSFRLFSLLGVGGSAVIAKAFQIGYMLAASDVTVSDLFTYIFLIGYELFTLLALILAVCVTVYAYSYFGKKTAFFASLISAGCLALGKLIIFVYRNFINYAFYAPRLWAGVITYSFEILFDVLCIAVAFAVSAFFAKGRASRKKDDAHLRFSPVKACITSSLVCIFINRFLIPVIDLSAQNVIPFLIKYDNITSDEVISILLDYLYAIRFFPVYLIAAFALCLICFAALTRVTGKLKAKDY